MKTMLIAGYNV